MAALSLFFNKDFLFYFQEKFLSFVIRNFYHDTLVYNEDTDYLRKHTTVVEFILFCAKTKCDVV